MDTKRWYLAIVVSAGAVSIAVAALRAQPAAQLAATMTILLVIELTIRFRYVIALLAWPATPVRLTLLSAFWAGLVNLAWRVPDVGEWAVAAATLFLIGIAIEVHNLATRQWEIGNAALQRALRNDILRGIASATLATFAMIVVARRAPGWIPGLMGCLVVGDALRLTEMVLRHRRINRDR
jgi:hypothetical protein